MLARLTVLVALASAGFATSAHAAVILEIDVSDPSAIVFNSTAAFAENSVSNVSGADGITLRSFFTADAGQGQDDFLDSSNLDVLDGLLGSDRSTLNRIFVGSFQDLTPLDVNLYTNTGSDLFFRDTERALTGSATHDLSALSGTFPAAGTTGDVFAGDTFTSSRVIGQWTVVPEPSTAVLMSLGLVGLAVRRSRR